jgi:hypothetical protein
MDLELASTQSLLVLQLCFQLSCGIYGNFFNEIACDGIGTGRLIFLMLHLDLGTW